MGKLTAHTGMQFLHNHPGTEKRLRLDEGHVIVDKTDWIEAKKILAARESAISTWGKEVAMPSKEELEKFLTEGIFPDKEKDHTFITCVDLGTSPDTSAIIQVMKNNNLKDGNFLMFTAKQVQDANDLLVEMKTLARPSIPKYPWRTIEEITKE